MLIDYIREIHAKQSFKIKDNFEFIEFDDIAKEDLSPESPVPDHIEIWAAVKIYFDGTIPDSYKTLNLLIGDWVEENEEKLSKMIHEKLKEHFQAFYPGSDPSELDNGDSSSIWLDQLDYMPRVDETDKSLIIEIELIMDTEPLNED